MFISIVRDRDLRFIAICQFLALMAVGVFATGCGAQLNRIETAVVSIDERVARLEALEAMPPGTQVVDYEPTNRPVIDTAYLPVATTDTNRLVFKKARLDLGDLASRDIQIGK